MVLPVGTAERLQLQRVVWAQYTATRTQGAVLRKQDSTWALPWQGGGMKHRGGQPSGTLEATWRRAGECATGWLLVGTRPLERTNPHISSSSENSCSLEKGRTVFLEVNI